MVSQQHNAVDVEDLLDAARESLIDIGWRRTTITEVARRAGVSRMTVYRNWPGMDQLAAAVMRREWFRIIEHRHGDGDNPRDVLVDTLVRGARELRANPVLVRLITLDPEALIPYVFERASGTTHRVVELSIEGVRAGQASGDVRDGSPAVIARGLALILQSFIFSAHTLLGSDVTEDDLDDELRQILTRSLRP
jgi:AcrR family transcriptional regulator